MDASKDSSINQDELIESGSRTDFINNNSHVNSDQNLEKYPNLAINLKGINRIKNLQNDATLVKEYYH